MFSLSEREEWTISILIGSDDKLSQAEWSKYCKDIDEAIRTYAKEIHFHGYSHGGQPWQNACWVITVKSEDCSTLCQAIKPIRKEYHQNSIAITIAETEFI